MKRIRIKSIKFGSFMKLSIFTSVSFGIIFGILFFIIGLFGGDANANLGTMQLHGIAAGIVSLFISPLIFVIFGVVTGLMVFLPFKLLIRVTKGICILGEYELIEEENRIVSIENELDIDSEDRTNTENDSNS